MNLQQAFYELKFENAFLQAKGNAFQEFFEKLMGLAYKSDFMACRPWGNRGDRKNDGFLKSKRQLFQVYAPNEMKESVAIAKIREDFEGAKVYWGEHFNKWVFAHNAVNGLPPYVQYVLLEFEKANPGITLEIWGMEYDSSFQASFTGPCASYSGSSHSFELKSTQDDFCYLG